MNSLLRDKTTANKQAGGREGGPAGFIDISKSNLNNIERALKKLKASKGLNMTQQVYK